ncbi:MAG: dephospho-CoA kinase [Desulfovibrionaceae bacterium]|nr:dephospho-CoA kinase [Desulfovibrionaceae bacterium]
MSDSATFQETACAGAGVISFAVRPEDCRGKGLRLDQALMRMLASAGGTASGNGEAPDPHAGFPGECEPEVEDGDEAAARPCPALSREAVKKAVQAGLCTRNGQICTQASARLRAGDVITFAPPVREENLVPEDGPLSVIWQDDDLLVLDKPAGLTVHPCPSCPSGTLIQRVAHAFPEVAAMGGLRPGIVHRLDKETSGLILIARNEETRLAMTRAFAERRVHKEYLAVVSGCPEAAGSSRESIGRDPARKTRMACVPLSQGGRTAHTEYSTLWTSPDRQASLVRVRIHTGRTHQIRVHMTALGHPLLGDSLYCEGAHREAAGMAPRVMLHAFHLTFAHPRSGRELEFLLPPPADFRDCLLRCARQTQCAVLTGNPGSGKSTVRGLFAEHGAACISADELVTGYYGPGGALAFWISGRLGPDLLAADGSVDKVRLMACLEERPAFRRELETQAHALVRSDIQSFFDDCRHRHLPRAVAEIPLYFECGWHRNGFSPTPLSIGVRAGLAGRRQRLAATRGWSEGKIDAIEGWQWEEERKLAACDIVLDNTNGLDDLEESFTRTLLPELDERMRAGDREFSRWLDSAWGGAGRNPADR